MRYSIEGFSQIEALKFRRIEIVKDSKGNDKEKVVTLDCTDLVILRWFVDFWPNMMKVEIGGRQYAWLSYKAAVEDMPILGVKKGMFALRLKKLVDFGILSHKTVKSGGTFSYYGFGPQYARLVDSKQAQDVEDPTQNISDPLPKKLETPAQNFGDQIDPNTKDPSTTQPKKERKARSTFDAIIAERTDNPELVEALGEFIRMRVRIKKPLTDYALKLRLDRLWEIGKTDEERVAIVNQSIGACWQDFFELKDGSSSRNGGDRKRRVKKTTEEPKVGSKRYDSTTGVTEIYKGNGVWEKQQPTLFDEECEDIDF